MGAFILVQGLLSPICHYCSRSTFQRTVTPQSHYEPLLTQLWRDVDEAVLLLITIETSDNHRLRLLHVTVDDTFHGNVPKQSQANHWEQD
jgi:hypothetical protein